MSRLTAGTVAEKARMARLKGTTALTGAVIGLAALGSQALAGGPPLPAGGQVVSGSATISTSSTQVTVTEQSSRVVIDWSSFNLGAGGSVVYLGPNGQPLSSSQAAINLVTGGSGPSQVGGSINAGQGLFTLSNPAGIVFAPGAMVNAGSLIATTAGMSSQDIATFGSGGRLSFSIPGQGNATVSNQGSLTVAQNGIAALVAPGVQNSGVINARLSTVKLASATTIYADFYGDRLVNVAVGGQVTQTPVDANGNALNSAVENSGKIVADGGTVQITANVARGVVNNAINMSGVVQAQAVTQQGGTIVLDGGSSGVVNIAGTVDASGRGAGQSGGAVQVNGAAVAHTGTIDVSGTQAGGKITMTASDIVQSGQMLADASAGAGGTIDIQFSGTYAGTVSAILSAQGSSAGGSVAITSTASGSGLLTSGMYRAGSSSGQGGSVLIDADNIILAAAAADASGATGGGTIAIGGGPHFDGGELPAATSTFVSATTTLSANALGNGNGGHIVIWSQQQTTAEGLLSVRGGSNSGNGGLIEVSAAAGQATFNGTAPDVSAPNGAAGTVLLDPAVIIIDAVAGSLPQFQLMNPDPGDPKTRFGSWVIALPNGNIAVSDPTRSVGGNPFAGAVYLFNGTSGGLIGTVLGANANDALGLDGLIPLTSGNFLAFSPFVGSSAALGTAPGAVTFLSGTSGLSGFATVSNSLVNNASVPGGLASLGNTPVPCLTGQPAFSAAACAGILTNIGINNPQSSPLAAAGAFAALGLPPGSNLAFFPFTFRALPDGDFELVNTVANTVTVASGATGVSGILSGSNSLLNALLPSQGDLPGGILSPCLQVPAACGLTGGSSFTVLRNGNVVASTGAGATFFNLNAGAVVGSANINAGNTLAGGGAVTALSNGNYVVATPNALGGEGAVTFGIGTSGVSGAISAANSLVGVSASDAVGSGGVLALNNGNYVVLSPNFGNGKGAATLGNGQTGTVGMVSASNSLVGNANTDAVGSGGAVALTNGNFVVVSPQFAGGKGAATFGNGQTGISGAVSALNSLVGNASTDSVGSGGVTPLTNGSYVVLSPSFGNGIGAATFGNGSIGTAGVISGADSIIGATAGDFMAATVTPLTNGNYVVGLPNFNGTRGAAAFASGTAATSEVVSAANSLVGVNPGDQIAGGNNGFGPGVVALSNGNYVVVSPTFDGGAGAVTFGSGTSGIVGPVSVGNSLVGAPGQALGSGNFGSLNAALVPGGVNFDGVSNFINEASIPVTSADGSVARAFFGVAPTASGNYIVISGNSVTFGSGTTGVSGSVSSANSLTGLDTRLGEILLLPTGGYLVTQSTATGDSIFFGSPTAGVTSSSLNASNLLSGPFVGFTGLNQLTGAFGNPALTSAAVFQTLFAQNVIQTPGTPITAANLTQFGITNGGVFAPQVTVLSNGNFVVSNSLVSFDGFGGATLGSGTTGFSGPVSAANSLVGNGMAFGSRIVDDAALGTFIAYAAFGNGPVIVGANSLKGDQLLLSSFGAAGQTETVTPTFIQQVLEEGGTFVLSATEKIVINSPFLPTQRGTLILDAPRLFATGVNGITSLQFAPNTIFDGLPLPEQVIPQMLDMVGVMQPQEGVLSVAYSGPMAPLCVTVRPDGGCETEPTGSLNDAVSSRGNAYLGDLRLASPVPKSPDFSIPPNFPATRLVLPEPPPTP